MKRIAITSVYANPLHPGHIECFELSRALADELIVIVNNDHQAKLKRGTESFQDEQYRLKLVESIKPVSRAVLSIDEDPSVRKTLARIIEDIRATHGDECEIIFTKGGDRFANEIPERVVCDQYGVRIVDGLGAKTHNSSSYIARVANKADTEQLSAELANIPNEHKEKEYIEVGMRPWGVYYVLEDQPNFKIKKIIVSPKRRLSLQSHEKRSEHWVVVSGTAHVQIREKDHPDHIGHRVVNANESCFVPQGHIHRLSNEHDDHLVVIEVQCGDYTGEDDITRYHDDFGRSAG
jgi:cytidyltransferase-like protein